jgi:hypothetical protein
VQEDASLASVPAPESVVTLVSDPPSVASGPTSLAPASEGA